MIDPDEFRDFVLMKSLLCDFETHLDEWVDELISKKESPALIANISKASGLVESAVEQLFQAWSLLQDEFLDDLIIGNDSEENRSSPLDNLSRYKNR